MAGNQVQQIFIQAVMTRGALLEADTKELYRKTLTACGRTTEGTSFNSFITSINRQLKPLDMELVNSLMEDSYERWYGLVNRAADPGAKIASKHSPAELEFFNKVMELIVTNDGIASSTALINASCSLERKLTGSDAESFLKTLMKNKWLCEVSPGKYGAGPRFILELRPFLSDIFKEDVTQCKICKEPVIRGTSCGNSDCRVKLHLLCVARVAQGRESLKCPGCRNNWASEIPSIELPVRQDSQRSDQPPSDLPGPSKRPRKSAK